ncbi:MAG: c-type cytochrome [Gammaproteobacteria bacterium]
MRKALLFLGACALVCSGGCAMVAGEAAGEKVYNSACVACHSTGAAGAPKVGDKESWRPRAGEGLEALVNNAINGKRSMPAKGGNPGLTDEEIKQAVRYMLARTGISDD